MTVIAVATILATFLTTVSEVQAQEQGPLRNKNDTSMCIGIDGGSKNPGALAKLFRCDGRQNQNYTFEPQSGTGNFVIRARHSGLCLTEALLSGIPVIAQYRCVPDPGQIFRKGNVSGAFFSLIDPFYGECIGVSGGQPDSGVLIGTFTCDGSGNQQWRR